jgi:hypothetical protein
MSYSTVARQCEHCGKDFRASTANVCRGMGKYCSATCARRGIGNKPKVECTCHGCGTRFTQFASVIAQGRGKFCSTTCAKNSRRKSKEERPCDHCGRVCLLLPWRLRMVSSSFHCSKECQHAAAVKGEWKQCEHCTELFFQRPCHAAQGKGRFCSHDCYHAENNGPKHHLWRGGHSHSEKRQPFEFTSREKRLILERDDYTCQCCGDTEERLQVDHVIPIHLGGTKDLSNGQSLCVPCHKSKSAAEQRQRLAVA